MGGSTRVTPLDLLRESFVKKTYMAIVCSDGTVLPIEERIGKRLLRVIEPHSREASRLLARGVVNLKNPDGSPPLEQAKASHTRDH